MRKLVLIAAFGMGAVCLLPKQARSLEECTACDCKEMMAWQWVSLAPETVGLRKLADDGKTYVPVAHVPDVKTPSGGVARWLSTKTDAGVSTSQSVIYDLCKYKETPVLDCLVAKNEHGDSAVRVTFAKEEHWASYGWFYPHRTVTQALCKPKQED